MAVTLITVFLLVLLIVPGLLINTQAMGQAPSTCNNRYDGGFTSFRANNGTANFNPAVNPDSTFVADASSGYSVAFSLESANMSVTGNTSPGQIWYVTDYPNGYFGYCINVSGPNTYISDDIHVSGGDPTNQNPQSVVWGNLSNYNQVSYNVDWISKYTILTTDSSGNPLTGLSALLYQGGQVVDAGTSPVTFTLQQLTSYTLVMQNTESYVFSHWADTGSTNQTRNIPYNDGDLTLTAVYVSASNSTGTSTSSVTINSVDQNGNQISGYYLALYASNGNVIGTGFTPETFSTAAGSAYSVQVDNYGSCSFSHWTNGATSDPIPFTATSGSMTLTAVYNCGVSPTTFHSSTSTTSATPTTTSQITTTLTTTQTATPTSITSQSTSTSQTSATTQSTSSTSSTGLCILVVCLPLLTNGGALFAGLQHFLLLTLISATGALVVIRSPIRAKLRSDSKQQD